MKDVWFFLLEQMAQSEPWPDEIHALTLKVEHWDTRCLEVGPKRTRTSPLFEMNHYHFYPEALQIAA
jgi:hypothetical protein